MSDMKALVLTAGEGKRLRPITANRSKSMLMIAGHPVLEYILESLKANGIHDIVVVAGHGREELIEHFQHGADHDTRIRYVIQHEQKGAENAILLARDELENDEEFLLVNGDVLVESDMVSRTLENHHTMDGFVTMLVTLVSNPEQFGTVKIGTGGLVERLVEKGGPERYISNYAVAGVSIFNSEVLQYLEKHKTMESAYEHMIADKKKIAATVWEKEWAEFTWPWDLLKANHIVMDRRLRGKGTYIAESAQIHDSVVLEGPVHIDEGCIIRPNTTLRGPLYLGRDVYIGNNSLIREYASLSNNVRIGYSVEIRNSMFFSNVNVGRMTYVGDSIVGADTCIEAGAQLWNWRPGKEPIYICYDDTRVQIPMEKFGAVIGDCVIIGVNSSLYPATRVGENSTISPGCVISENIPPDSEVMIEQKLKITPKKK